MKHFFFTFLASLCFASVNAQLTMANHAPVIGEQHERYQCDSTNINPGAAGANVLWNFSMATRLSVVHSYTALSSSFFQPATVSLESDRGYEDHYQVTQNVLRDYSRSFPITPGYYINLNYNSPALKAVYPMSLGSTASGAINGNINAIMINAQAGTYTGNASTLADGTGTLILPGITYTNVLRVVNTENMSYTTSFPGTIVTKNYEYYAEGIKNPVFAIATVTLTRPAGTVRGTMVTRIKHAAPIDITAENDKLVCENNPATLSVSGADNIEWFDSMAATTVLGSGPVYVTDPKPAGVYTYYAQVTDLASSPRTAITFTATDCLSLHEKMNNKVVNLYPNPSTGSFSLDLSNEISSLEVYNVSGRFIQNQTTRHGTNTLDLTKQADGIYFIKLLKKDVVVAVKKVVIQSSH